MRLSKLQQRLCKKDDDNERVSLYKDVDEDDRDDEDDNDDDYDDVDFLW